MAVAAHPYAGTQVIVAIDFSGSMDDPISKNSKQRRIDAVKEKIHYVFNEVCKFDPDGIDVITFNNKVRVINRVCTPEAVNAIFKKTPGGGTDTTGAVLEAFNLHQHYRQQRGFKATVVLILTDGEPSDPQGLKNTLIDLSSRVASGTEIGFSFLQVGHDEKAHAYLTSLDDLDVNNDIVDRKNFSDLGTTLTMEKIVYKALNG